MARQPQSFFLEEWLRSIIIGSSNKEVSVHSSSSAQAIIKAWADLRDALQTQSFHAHHVQALKVLVDSQATLHVADPQAKLLISILSSQLSVPPESYSLFFRLLYIWLRKSRQTSQAVDSAANVILRLFSQKPNVERNSYFFSEGILLLGALSFQTSASDKYKRLCVELLSKLLEETCEFIFSTDELASSALAAAGYALSSSVDVYFRGILDLLLRIWGRKSGYSCNISQGLMLLHVIEWALSNSLNSRSLNKIDFVREVLEQVKMDYSSSAVVMVAAGVLRAVNRSGSSGFMHLKISAENCIEIVAADFVSRTKPLSYIDTQSMCNPLCQCMALALARSGSISFRASVLATLALSLLTEVFPLPRIYGKLLKFPEETWAAIEDEIKDHLNSVIFKEGGAITAAFCNQYALADENSRMAVETQIWGYCQEVYLWHRQARTLLVGRYDSLIGNIEKIAESAFLMVVVFALGVTKHRLDGRVNQEIQLEVSVKILVSFSCMEFFRRLRLPEYVDTVRAVIGSVQENESACVTFVESMPSYDNLINNHGSSSLQKLEYLWSLDEVQTARIVFYLRVVPTCVDRLPTSVFKQSVAPIMFLYMGHPNGKVARYSHSLFVAFLSSGKDPCVDDRVQLKEQLVFYYLERSLEGYPGITPFEGMASGVAAIVRYLPAELGRAVGAS
ncbi:uncharacterized protein LOC127250586 isoform X2 [Andrographis paniculata]|uniref:uncharacterized protein LOC127250586 isoform X2 n=1 Tax=Andrographis paniculata TaxID=175694 RepID=UPI0021E748CB|nr:uncharacterized protein LOC127250586 isoform X2 [Andrographis paniculata]